MLVALAVAADGSGVGAAMAIIVTMIIGLAGAGVAGACAWKGLQFAYAQDYRHVGESLLGLAVGGGMILASRQLGGLLVGGAAGSVLGPVTAQGLMDEVGTLFFLALYYGPFMAGTMRLWLRRGRRD